jgi:hypothetical protein
VGRHRAQGLAEGRLRRSPPPHGNRPAVRRLPTA